MRRRLFAAIAAMTLLVAACGNSGDDDDSGSPTTASTQAGGNGSTGDLTENVPVDEVGVSDDTIRFSSISTITSNPLGTDIGNAFNSGIKAYFEWRNSEGGIYGRQLELANERDDQLFLNEQEAQALVDEDDAFGAFVATLGFSGADTLNDNQVPTFGWNIHAEFADRPYIFGHLGALCNSGGEECAGRPIPWLAKEVGASKVGILAYGNSANSQKCAEGQRRSYEYYSDATGGIEVAFFDNNLEYGLANGIAPQVSEMKDEGVTFISACMDLNGMKTLAEEMQKQGLDATLQHPNTYNQDFVAENAEIFEGDYVGPQFVPFEAAEGIPMAEKFQEWIAETGAEQTELTMIGWIAADIAYTGLAKAGPQFSRDAVVAALNSTTDYSAGGLVVPIDWTKQHDDPATNPESAGKYECITLVQVEGGEFVPAFGEPGKPFMCWDNESDELTDPVPMSFVPEDAAE